MGIIRKIFPKRNDKEIARLSKVADQIEALKDKFRAMSDEELRACTEKYKERYANGESLDNLLVEAFATVREASRRVLNMEHFYVQLLGGIVLHQGRIAEMKTGEGKTLVATLPSYLNALSGKGVHIVTVNEYLAARDAEWMGKIHRFLGLTVGVVIPGMKPQEKQLAYACDIVYCTNNELGFDYLRDNMCVDVKDKVQKSLNYALIDEVDSILIDEARTPLIISGPSNKSSEMYIRANRFAKGLKIDDDFEMDEKDKTIRLTDDGISKAEKYFSIDNLGDIENTEIAHHINLALRAHNLMIKDVDYIVLDNQIIIVDENTGRQMIGRRYSDGLHQAIEAKESVRIQNESKTYATITFQNYFRLYNKLSGMTGTAKTEETEFKGVYSLDVVEIPTNMPMARVDYNDLLYKNKAGKMRAILKDVQECYEHGQPVLIGTISVDKSEELSKMLKTHHILHNVLNAKNHERESEIVAQAGKYKAVTIATNMAGRGTDIMLGGNPEYLAKQKLLSMGYSKELIDRATSFAYTEDEEVLKAKHDYNHYYEEFKKNTDEEKQKVIEAGGLRILGTERHDSRRIDNQLRGRAGRQGDPGSTVFYISMEDDIARIFGGDRLYSIADRFNLDEDTPISNKIITGQIEKAQLIVESRNYSARKNILSYDDIMNKQREVIYAERQKVLNKGVVHDEILTMMKRLAEDMVAYFIDMRQPVDTWDLEGLNKAINDRLLPNIIDEDGERVIEEVVDVDLACTRMPNKIVDRIMEKAVEALEEKKKEINEKGANFDEIERVVMLKMVDRHWIDHIDSMEELKRGVGLRAYGQKDPVVIFRQEGYEMFDDMIFHIQRDTVRTLMKLNVEVEKPVTMQKQNNNLRTNLSGQGNSPARIDKKPGRNEPCPCGSGKKYKHCCGK